LGEAEVRGRPPAAAAAAAAEAPPAPPPLTATASLLPLPAAGAGDARSPLLLSAAAPLTAPGDSTAAAATPLALGRLEVAAVNSPPATLVACRRLPDSRGSPARSLWAGAAPRERGKRQPGAEGNKPDPQLRP
jgi:hypothetical protein